MSFSLNVIFSLTIGIGAIISWIRFNKTDPAFFPFTLLLTTGLINEIAGIWLVYLGYSNAICYNLFLLAESLLITWQFRKWGLFDNKATNYYFLQSAYICGWTIECVLSDENRLFNSYFIIGHSIIIVMMSIIQINRMLFSVSRHLLKNPIFLISMGMSIYFTYTVIVEAFWVYGLNQSISFRLGIYEILSYINLFTNLLFAIATLCIPLKRQYIMQS